MHLSSFAQISLIISLAAGVAMVMRLLRQPLIIGYIVTGILVGPSVFHLVKSPATIDLFSNLGIALLLFIIGLGLNPRVVKEVGKVTAIVGVAQVALTTAAGYWLGLVCGFTPTASLVLGIALSFSSTIIVLKLLTDKREQTRLYGKIVTGLLLLQDLVAMVALLFVTANSGSGVDGSQLLSLLGKGLAIAIPMLLISNLLLPRLHRFIADSPEFLFLFALGWGFGGAALFEVSGLSMEVGALIAGIALASLPYTQAISSRLRPLRDFFVVVFFIVLGTQLDIHNLSGLWLPLVLISAVVILIKPIIVTTLMSLLGYTKRTSFKAGIAIAQVSEFSIILILLARQNNLVNGQFVTLITLVALITIAVSTYLIMYADELFVVFEKYWFLFERKHARPDHEARAQYQLVLFGYRKGGHEFLQVFKSLKKRFVVVDYDPEVIDILEHQKVEYIYGDVADIELLEEIGLQKTKLVVSTITDFQITKQLVSLLNGLNPDAVVICHGDSIEEAAALYEAGASYVMMPHYIGSEKIGAFIKRNGFSKTEFKHFREKHLAYLEIHTKDFETETPIEIAD